MYTHIVCTGSATNVFMFEESAPPLRSHNLRPSVQGQGRLRQLGYFCVRMIYQFAHAFFVFLPFASFLCWRVLQATAFPQGRPQACLRIVAFLCLSFVGTRLHANFPSGITLVCRIVFRAPTRTLTLPPPRACVPMHGRPCAWAPVCSGFPRAVGRTSVDLTLIRLRAPPRSWLHLFFKDDGLMISIFNPMNRP